MSMFSFAPGSLLFDPVLTYQQFETAQDQALLPVSLNDREDLVGYDFYGTELWAPATVPWGEQYVGTTVGHLPPPVYPNPEPPTFLFLVLALLAVVCWVDIRGRIKR